MTESDTARLFRAMYGREPLDEETRKKAFRRLVCSEDGLTLIKHFSPCLQTRVNASNGVPLEYMEGRRSVIMEIIKLAIKEGENNG